MEHYIYLNYAHEDHQLIQPVLDRLDQAGIQVLAGHASEEKITEAEFALVIFSPQTRNSRSFRKGINTILKNEMDCIMIHMTEEGIKTDIELKLNTVLELFKVKYTGTSVTAETSEEAEERTEEIKVAPEAEAKKEPVIQIIEFSADGTQKISEEEKVVPTEEKKEPEAAEVKVVKAEPETKEGIYELGMRYLEGNGVEKDYDKAFIYFKQAAHQGLADAQYQLSSCYEEGIGIKKDFIEAARWCEMAAYGGNVTAQGEIGYRYECGHGLVRNMKEAVRWYEIAAERGSREAANNLAFCYQKGRGVMRNLEKALALYKQSAEAGHSSAQYNLGFCYWYGEGVEADKDIAINYFKQSAENGNTKASQMLKILSQRSIIQSGKEK